MYTAILSDTGINSQKPLQKVHIPYLKLDCNSQEERELNRWGENYIHVTQPLYMVEKKKYLNTYLDCTKKNIYSIKTTTTYTTKGKFYYFSIEEKLCITTERVWTCANLHLGPQTPPLQLFATDYIDEEIEYYSF